MLQRLSTSLKNIDYKMLFALLFLGFCPTVYTTLRIFFLGTLPDTASYSIAGQLSWLNLLYEILREALILPLFCFLGKSNENQGKFANRLRSGLFLTFFIYSAFTAVIMFTAKPLLSFMAASEAVADASAKYIKIESAAYIFGTLEAFTQVALVSLGKSKHVYILTISKLLLCILSDIFLVSPLRLSLNLGVNGIGWSNLLVNTAMFIISLFLLSRQNREILSLKKISFAGLKEFAPVGIVSGLESFVRNAAYMLMIIRMVNAVNEQGLYWVANSFIWGWLVLPITQLAELIKRETAADKENIRRCTLGYFLITAAICVLWFVSVPFWEPFMRGVLRYGNTDRLFRLVLMLIGFYVLYAFQNIFDSTFYGMGKTGYMLFESVVTNIIYYGAAYILYAVGAWVPTLDGIVLLFGGGIAFDSFVSLSAYIFMLKKQKINILEPGTESRI